MNRLQCALIALPALLAACTAAPDDPPMSGYAEADLVYIAASAAGTIESLAVQRGDAVRRGQLLFALDAVAESQGASAAAARQERAEAQASNLRKGRRPAELKAIDEQLAQAQAALTASASSLRRQQQLVTQGFVAEVKLEELVATRDRDAARLKELQAQRAVAADASRSDEIAAAAAEARGTQADAEVARWREGQKQRQAPVDARVFDVMYRVGEFVPAGAPVLSLLAPTALKVRFFVPQSALPRAAVGGEVGLRCDGCPDGLRGRIRWLSPQAEYTPPVIYSNASRNKLVFLAEAAPDAAAVSLLKPGQAVDVQLPAVRATP